MTVYNNLYSQIIYFYEAQILQSSTLYSSHDSQMIYGLETFNVMT